MSNRKKIIIILIVIAGMALLYFLVQNMQKKVDVKMYNNDGKELDPVTGDIILSPEKIQWQHDEFNRRKGTI